MMHGPQMEGCGKMQFRYPKFTQILVTDNASFKLT